MNHPLRLNLNLGYGQGEVPIPEKFNLSRLRGYSQSYSGDLRITTSADLLFPIIRDLEHKILNLVVFKGVDGGVVADAGDVWEARVESINFDDLKTDVGAEIGLNLALVGGLPIQARVGYAYPLWHGKPLKDETGRFYTGAGVGFPF